MRFNASILVNGCLRVLGGVGCSLLVVLASVSARDIEAATALPRPVLAQAAAPPRMTPAPSNGEAPKPATRATASPVGPDPGKGFIRLAGHVLPALANAIPTRDRASVAAQEPTPQMTLTLVLKRDDPAGFEHYLKSVYDAGSPRYHKFLSQAQITKRFGPSRQSYAKVTSYLRTNGLELQADSKNRLTLSVRGPRAAVERAFALNVVDYTLGSAAFYANDSDPRLPEALAAHVENIGGLANLAVPHGTKESNPALWGMLCGGGPGINTDMIGATEGVGTSIGVSLTGMYAANAPPWALSLYPAATYISRFSFVFFLAALEWQLLCQLDSMGAFDGPQNAVSRPYNSFMPRAGLGTTRQTNNATAQEGTDSADGTGQTIGLLEFDNFQKSDVEDYLNLTQGSAANAANLSAVPVNGGAVAGADQDEVLLDIDTVMSIAPGAKVVVYNAPFDGKPTSYTALFNAMINGGVNIISNSWSSCEDQVSQADAQGIDQVLQTAAASGISVFNGTGDSGSTCLDGKPNTVGVPADSPSATAVGGTTLHLGPGFSYQGETWWDGSKSTPQSGQGGYGVSSYFSRPTYQDGLTSATGRSIPDVAIDADPATGMAICQASAGGCPVSASYGGTSMAAPEMAAYAALLNAAVGKSLGALNSQIYKFANTTAFHSAASMSSDFGHVGLGSPNVDALYLAITGQTAGLPSATTSAVIPLEPASVIIAGTPNSSAGVANIASDGQAVGGVLVQLFDAKGNTVSGKSVTVGISAGSAKLAPASAVTDNHGIAVFTATDLVTEPVTFTVMDTTDGLALTQTASLNFVPPPASNANLSVFPTSVAADGSSTATVTVTLEDSLGRATPGKLITLGQGSGHSVITGPNPSVTDSNGQIQFTVVDDTNESISYTATDVTDGSLPVPGNGTVAFNGATAGDCSSNPPTAATGYVLTAFATGAPAGDFNYSNINFGGCPGAGNPYFTTGGTVLIPDFHSGDVYQVGASGGAFDSSAVLVNLDPSIGTPIYGADGNLYVTRFATGAGFSSGDVIQLDPTTGAIVREVVTGLTCPNSLVRDPLSGDLFFDDQCFGGGSDNPSVWRVSAPGSATPTVVVYATLPGVGGQQQLVFAPNGTLYAASGGGGNPTVLVSISGTNTPQPATVTTVAGLTPDNGSLAIGLTNADGSAKTLLVHEAGTGGGALETVDITGATPSIDTVLAVGDIGAGTVGPDGCYYIGDHHAVYKLAPASGACALTPSSPTVTLTLSPSSVSPNPGRGSLQTFTATLKNTALASVPVVFHVGGANPQLKLARTDANGTATFSYSAIYAGQDTVTASASVAAPGTQQIQSVKAQRTVAFAMPSTNLAATAAGGGAGGGGAAGSGGLTGGGAAVSSSGLTAGGAPGSGGPAFAKLTNATRGGTRFPPVAVPSAANIAHVALKREGVADASAPNTLPVVSNSVQITWDTGVHSSFLSLNGGPTAGTVGTAVGVVASLTDVSAQPMAGASGQIVTFELAGASCNATTDTSGSATCQLTPAQPGTATLTANFAGNSQLAAASKSAAFNVHIVQASAAPPPPTTTSVTVTARSGGGAIDVKLSLLLLVLVFLRLYPVVAGRRPRFPAAVLLVCGCLAMMVGGSARADESSVSSDHSDPAAGFYVGIRSGSMPVHFDAERVEGRLHDAGYDGLQASGSSSTAAGTLYVGYQFAPLVALDLGYTHRAPRSAVLSGTVPAGTSVPALLQSAANAVEGYGDIYSLTFRPSVEIYPRVTLEPRVGAFFWDTKVTASLDGESARATHRGGGATVGFGVAYRLWRDLKLGVGVDYFRGTQDNTATLVGGSLEWRFR